MQELSLEQCDRLHAEQLETGLNAQAANLRRKVRAYCVDNALAVPSWASEPKAAAPPKPAQSPRKHNVLEARAARYAQLLAAGNAHDATSLRASTRAWCAAAGVPVPEWAKLQGKPHVKAAPEELRQALHDWRDATEGRSVQVGDDGSVTLLRQTERGLLKATFPSMTAAVESRARWSPAVPARPELPRAEPLPLPRALRAWRAASGDRAISIASDGTVTLLRSDREGKHRATFPSLEAAAAAVEPPIAWVAVEATRQSWAHAGRR